MNFEFHQGLYNWYPFNSNENILFLDNQNIAFLADITDNSLDCIIGIGFFEQSKNISFILSELYRILKPSGHLFLGVDNRLGLRYFCGDTEPHSERVFDGLENYQNFMESDRVNMGGRLYASYEIEELLKQAGFTRWRRYSILPGLEMPQQMYASDYLPEEEVKIRFTGLYHNPDSVFLDESNLYGGVIKNGMFHQMANAYLYECSHEGNFYEVNHVTTSMDRGKKKATATIIEKSGRVVKKALYMDGNMAIEQLYDNIEFLSKRGIRVVPLSKVEFDNGCIGVSMPYVKNETALTYLRRIINIDVALFKKEVKRFIQLILDSSEPSDNQPANNELGVLYQRAFIDMVPLNCFFDGKDFIFYDQEYVEYDYPIYMVILRALDIIYMGDRAMLEKVPLEYFLIGSGVEGKISALRDMGTRFIKKIRNQDLLAEFNQKHKANQMTININRQRVTYSLEEYRRLFVDLIDENEDKDIYIFGSGLWARKFVVEYGKQCRIICMVDNNSINQGKRIDGFGVESPEVLNKIDKSHIKVIICIKYYAMVKKQLEDMGIVNIGIYDPNLDISMYRKNNISIDLKSGILSKNIDANTEKENLYKVGYLAGVFDLFHIGHLNILKRAKEQCDYLVVGVVSDEQATKTKNKSPYINENERLEIVKACRYVDEAFILHPIASGTRDVYKKYHFDVQFSGSDYENDPYWLQEQAWLRERGSDLVFFPYTQSTSSTKLKEKIEADTER